LGEEGTCGRALSHLFGRDKTDSKLVQGGTSISPSKGLKKSGNKRLNTKKLRNKDGFNRSKNEPHDDDQPKENPSSTGPESVRGVTQVRQILEETSKAKSKPKSKSKGSSSEEFAHLKSFIQNNHAGSIRPDEVKGEFLLRKLG
jgi:hypothetical protein